MAKKKNKKDKAKRKRNTQRGSVHVAREVKIDGEKTSRPTVSREFDVDLEDLQHTGAVSVTGGLTKHLKNHNFVKIGIMVHMPCDYRTTANYDEAKARAAELVDGYMEEEYESAIGDNPALDEDDE